MALRLSRLAQATWVDRERITVYPRIFIALYALAIVVWLVLSQGLVDPRGKPIAPDFVSFWAASSIALQGTPEAVYDLARHRDAERMAIGSDTIPYYGFHYPPMFLTIALPLALLPYGWSLAAWIASTFLAYLWVVRTIVPRPNIVWLAAAFPAAFINLAHGQNGFLTTAILGGAIVLLDRRPIWAGILIGLLTFKPQLGILIPIVLVATASWRVFFSATASSLALAGVAVVLFGVETWTAFIDNIPIANRVMTDGHVAWQNMQSVFAWVRLVGGTTTLGFAVHGIFACVVAAAVVWIWRQPVETSLKGAALVTGALMVTPFVLDYDLVLLALPLAWLGYQGYRTGFLPWEKICLVAIWLLPMIARPLNFIVPFPATPVVLACLLVLIARRARWGGRIAPARRPGAG